MKQAYGTAVLTLGFVLWTSAAAAQPLTTAEAARLFGMREDAVDVSISPDGKTLAIIRSLGATASVLGVVPVDGGTPRLITSSTGQPEQLTGCHWSTATRIVCDIYLIEQAGDHFLSFSRVIAVDSDGKNQRLLSAQPSDRALSFVQAGGSVIDYLPDESGSAVLMTRHVVAESEIGTRLAEQASGLALERVDTVKVTRARREPVRPNAINYITDGHGTVRIDALTSSGKNGYAGNEIIYQYRKPDTREWTPLSRITVNGRSTEFKPRAVDRDLNAAYGFADLDGRTALYRVTLDGSLKRDLVFAHPHVDVDGLIRIGRQQRVVGVTFATEKQEAVFFDPELKALSQNLSRALPRTPSITFLDASADEKKLVLFAGGDDDPGRYYVYDKTSRELNEVQPARPQLAGVPLATVKPITFTAADGTPVPGYLTLPPGSDGRGLPAIVMPHGGPSARDVWGFDWLAQFFANRGFAVLQPNYRGSTGYGSTYYEKNGFQSWRTAIGDINDSGRWLVSQGIAEPSKLAIVGWSYGGYAALQSAVLDPSLFKAIIAIAPVTDLALLRRDARDFTNYENVADFIGEGRHIVEGSPAQNVARFQAPVLLFHGDHDLNVDVGESRLMAVKLRDAGKQVSLIELPRLDHHLNDNEARAAMLMKSDTFLRTILKM